VKEALLKQIEIDVSLFKLLEINDYSLLLGIHNLEDSEEGAALLEKHEEGRWSFQEKVGQVLHKDYGDFLVLDKDRFDFAFFESIDGGVLSRDKKKIYFIGIIDTLTYFGTKKQFEYLVKGSIYGRTISCVPPRTYGERFFNYMTKEVIA